MTEAAQLTGGELNAAIARAVVSIHNQYVGRGPSKGQSFYRDRLVVVLMEEVLTKGERSLVEDGREQLVLNMRREFQRAMEDELVGAVERLTGAKVEAFMSDSHVAPDMTAELFVLDRRVPTPAPPSLSMTRG